jgi:abhydrolase domain-containing protein 17
MGNPNLNKKSLLRKLLIGNFAIRRLIGSVVFIYVFITGGAYFFSDRMIFMPQRHDYNDHNRFVRIKTLDGTQISACYLPNPRAEFTMLYSHGNAENIGDLYDLFESFHDNGFSVFAYDYHGYGANNGKPSEKNSYQDIEAAYLYMVNNLKIPSDRIVVLGRSVGSGPATHLACHEKVAALILESPFVSAFRVLTKIPLLPFDKFNNISKIKYVHCPVLVIHGTDDNIIPLWHGEKLFKAANQPKYNFWVEGAGHNDLTFKAGDNYWRAIKNFVGTIKPSEKIDIKATSGNTI